MFLDLLPIKEENIEGRQHRGQEQMGHLEQYPRCAEHRNRASDVILGAFHLHVLDVEINRPIPEDIGNESRQETEHRNQFLHWSKKNTTRITS